MVTGPYSLQWRTTRGEIPIDARIRAEIFKDALLTPSPTGRGLG
jgi:hypothetical protein